MTKYTQENVDLLRAPKHFYVTFHHEYALFKTLEHAKKKPFDLFGDEVKIKAATEPTDIIWENRHIRKKWRRVRWVVALLLMLIFATLGFMLIILLIKNKLAIDYLKEPPGIECESIIENYGTDLQQMAYKEVEFWQDKALQRNSFFSLNLNTQVSRRGALKCFCDKA